MADGPEGLWRLIGGNLPDQAPVREVPINSDRHSDKNSSARSIKYG
jgi:hypothetical protein